MFIPVGKSVMYIPSSTRTSTSTSGGESLTTMPPLLAIPVGCVFIGIGCFMIKTSWEQRFSFTEMLITLPLAFMCLLVGLMFILAPFCEKCGG